MGNNFPDRLYNAVRQKKTPLTVGIDPVYSRLPEPIKSHKDMNDEYDAQAALDAIFTYCRQVLHTVAPLVPAVKINIAFFEKYLWEGIEVYYSLLSEAEQLGVEIIGDVKRGDIGHTAELYAQAHLQNSELIGLENTIAPDAVTINGFSGVEGIEPFAKMADQQGKGVFVWVRSSNPGGAEIQDFENADGQKFYEKLADIVNSIATDNNRVSESGYSNIGMVVAGLKGEEIEKFRSKYENIWVLVPGYGAQGASAEDCVKYCKTDGTGLLVNSSRSIIYAYEKPKYKGQFGDDWKKCIEQAVIDAKMELSKAMETLI
jgi:orotidine-5'-phosphate decarboxylase